MLEKTKKKDVLHYKHERTNANDCSIVEFCRLFYALLERGKHQAWLGSILLCKITKEFLIKYIFFIAELKLMHNDNLPVYNHTLATILVEYASAVSSASNLNSEVRDNREVNLRFRSMQVF